MNLSAVRAHFPFAQHNKTAYDTAIAELQEVNFQSPPLHQGYKAAMIMVSANYLSFPLDKLKAFQRGRDWLEKVIAENPADVELRYIRLAVQMRSPVFLGYNSSIGIDKKFILNHLSKLQDKEALDHILAFIKTEPGLESSYRIQVSESVRQGFGAV